MQAQGGRGAAAATADRTMGGVAGQLAAAQASAQVQPGAQLVEGADFRVGRPAGAGGGWRPCSRP